jgi:subtilisin family serine protease
VVLALAGVVLTGAPVIASATASSASTATRGVVPAPKLPPGRTWKVTLLTGDAVRVTTVSKRPPLVSVEPGPGRRSVLFHKDVRSDGTVRVVPQDVAPQVGKLYDPALFDVTALIKDGDDDAKRPDLPLIVQGGTAAKSLVKAGRTLTSIGAGATGKGVKVAVLYTGVDATHPDLKGRIAEKENFSQTPDTTDRYGHGTHVASTIAGTGASANGERRGVAYEADLLVGKVLGDDGYGAESGVIAGMEWAAPKARIVNMSLGTPSYDPAGDPVTLAVDQLTRTHGTLFVVAAGNYGPSADTIEAPGAAASALTVGAVDGTDHVADFSSRGGLLMKPEIAAPGVDVIAARAAGTSMGHVIDAHYTAAGGTSMATPQVAGAAADLLQRHPDWSAERLKAALVSTADATGGTVYAVGAGRLDVGRAATTTIVGDQAAISFGSVPSGSTEDVSQRLSWTNTGPSPVRLKLAGTFSDPAGHDTGAVHLPATVTVPAGGSAGITASLDPGRLTTAGRYSGAVTAQAAGVSVRIPIGAYAEPESHALTLKATALPGTPPGAFRASAAVFDLDNPDLFNNTVFFDANGDAVLYVPAGHYAVLGEVDDTSGERRAAFAGTPDVTVDKDVSVPLDASRARPMRATAPRCRDRPIGRHQPASGVRPSERRLRDGPADLRGRSAALHHTHHRHSCGHVRRVRRVPAERQERRLRPAAPSRRPGAGGGELRAEGR